VWTSSLVAANTAALVDPPAQHSTQHSTVQYKSTTELICGANLPFKLYARPFMSYSLLIKCARLLFLGFRLVKSCFRRVWCLKE
jgi:hypothetical protein